MTNTQPKKGELLYEGKAKKVFATDNPDLVIQEFKDDATAFNGVKRGQIAGKGVVNNDLSCFLFKYLEGYGIPTHFVAQLSVREMLCKKLDIIKAEVVMRNVAAGSLVKRFNFVEGTELYRPILELYLKSDALGDPLMNYEHAIMLGVASEEELDFLEGYARKINHLLKEFFLSKALKLVDFKLEFGRHDGGILLGDEISPDTCRLWDKETNKKLDKDRFRQDLGDVEEAYLEVRHRIIGS